MFKKLLREPLLHFLLIGTALFVLYGLQNNPSTDNEKRIVISTADIDRLISLWGKKWQRLPTQTELDGMINSLVREEVLYREALAMGLDKGDSIVRRRLAQKVEFIFSDIASQVEVGDAELADYLTKHSDRFEIPANISFQQIYLNADKRGGAILNDAEELLNSLTQQDSTIDIRAAGDPFMFGQQHENLTKHAVSRLFGKEFSGALFKLAPGSWLGPVKSGYGLHLVQIKEMTAAKLPDLNTVRDKVRNEWHTEQRRKMNEDFYENLHTRYELVIEKTNEKNVLANNSSTDTK